jgi:hypothetical protein
MERDGGQRAGARHQPTSAGDASTAVGFARDHGLLLSIEGGGHKIARTSLADRGVTPDISAA